MTITQEIVEKFGKGALRRSALRLYDGESIFRQILGGGAYRTALEIGTYKGASAACMSQFCERVITIDLKIGALEKGAERWDRQAFWAALGRQNIELHLVADNGRKSELVNGLKFDFAFIDGAHDRTVERDFEITKRCGAVLFHDCVRHGIADKDCVADFIDTLPDEQVTILGAGFAFWQNAARDAVGSC